MPNPFCDCAQDGWCPRYQREQVGRFRAICAGVNVDLGTAAAFREQWRRECPLPGLGDPLPVSGGAAREVVASMDRELWSREVDVRARGKPLPLLLKTSQAPGDAVVATAAVYSLHRAHPGRYRTAVDSPWPAVWRHNPDVVPADSIPDALPLQMHYPAIHQSNERAVHFMQGFCEHLGSALGVPVPLLTNRPRLYFDDPWENPWEDHRELPPDGFWLVCSGGKRDFTNKLWGAHSYQQVLSLLRGRVNFVQVGGIRDNHPRLDGVVDLVGRTSLRSLFGLMRLARGVLCGVSLLMHVAAALERPAVVVVGGREPVAWNAYPRQQYLHTVGALDCCTPQGTRGGACWRSRVVQLGDGTALDADPCLRPVNGSPTRLGLPVWVPECMSLIRPATVADAVLMYDRCYDAKVPAL